MGIIAEIPVDRAEGRLYEHGWQSWSPSTIYRLEETPYRPVSERNRFLCYRPEVKVPEGAFWGEGLLAVQPAAKEPVQVFSVTDGRESVPSIRADLQGDRLVISANGLVEELTDTGPDGIEGALARWADGYAERLQVGPVRRAPTIWSSWYQYFTQVTEEDLIENLAAIDEFDLPVEVVQLDDGYQTAHGDWLSLSDRFGSLADLTARIGDSGRRAGIWVAPFLVFPDSVLAERQPDWLVGGPNDPVHAGCNWDRDLFALDATHPHALEYLTDIFTTMYGWGFDFFKIDFLYAGAVPGGRFEDVPPLVAYRRGVDAIRGAVGDSYLLGCGAPILSSVGLFDSMRVSPDTEPQFEPKDGDLSQPAVRSAMVTGRGRAFQHGRFWINDPDCLIVRPAIEGRETWAAHVEQFGGLRGSSDRIADLDAWGLETTRRLLSESPTAPFILSDTAN